MRFVPPAEANLIQRLPPYHVVGNVIAWAMRALPQRILRPFLMKFLTTVLGPSPALFSEGAILINRQGERFVDELSAPASALARQTPNEAYIGFDQTFAHKFSRWPNFVSTAPGIGYAYIEDYRRCRSDIFATARTATELAAKLDLPEITLLTLCSVTTPKTGAQDLRLHLQTSTPWDGSRATSYSPRVDCQSARTLKCLQKVILYQGFSLWERWGRVVCYSKDTAITWIVHSYPAVWPVRTAPHFTVDQFEN